MTLDQIRRAVHALLHELMNLQENSSHLFDHGIAIDGNNCILKSDYDLLKMVARELLRMFNEFSNLKRESLALSKANLLDGIDLRIDALPGTANNIKYFKESIKDAVNARHEVDNEFVQLCIDGMRECQAALTILRGVHDQVKDLQKI